MLQRYEKKCNFARPIHGLTHSAAVLPVTPRKTYSESELLAKAERYCAREEQCVSAVRRKLQEWGAAPACANAIVRHLLEERFIDERRYVRLYCQGKLRIQRWGRNKMVWELRGKGIADDLITEGLDSLSDDEYRTVLDKVAQAKWDTLRDGDEYIRRRKLTAYLISRGFTMEEVQEVSLQNQSAAAAGR